MADETPGRTSDETAKEARRLYQRGKFYLDCGLAADAIAPLTEVTQLAPESPTGWSTLAEALRAAGKRTAAEDAQAKADDLAAGRAAPEPKGRVFEVQPGGGIQMSERAAAPSDDQAGDAAPEPESEPELQAGPKIGGPDSAAAADHPERRAYTAAAQAQDWPAAEAAARALIAADPEDARAWGSLGMALRFQFKMADAVAAHEKAAGLEPDRLEYQGALAKTKWEAGFYQDAAAIYKDILQRMTPEGEVYADTRLAYAMVRMLLGDMAEGLEDYEWRWQTGKIALPKVSQPYWDGRAAPDDRILFFGEQGFGDAIQFARFIPMIADRCKKVIVPCKPAVERLIGSISEFAENVEVRGEMIGRNDFDQFVPAMSAMRIFGMDMARIPNGVPYLKADPGDVAKFQKRIGGGPERKIGIAWTGSPTNTISWKKTVDPALFARLFDLPGTAFYSLQKLRDDMPANVKQVPDAVTDLAPHLNDFADTAAAIECLDLVITVDTAVAHLAGALGKPVWTLIPNVPDWRWFLDRDDSPWYPSMRLYRQGGAGDWGAVMDRIRADLNDARPPTGTDRRDEADAPENQEKKKGLLGKLFGR